MTLRLATFNLKDFFAPRREEENAVVVAKVSNVAAILRRARADVVALQEVGSPELLDRLLTEVPELGYGAPVLGSEDRRGIRNVILSRLPVQWSQVHQAAALPFPTFVAGDPDPFPKRIPLRRGIVHVRVESGALGEVDILTGHFKSNLPAAMKAADGTEIAATAEALFVRGLVDQLFQRSPDHAICVMGDFNDTTDSLPVRLVCGIDSTSKLWLRPGALHVDEALRFSCFHGGSPTLIDHILLSEKLHRGLRSFEIHNEALRYHGPHIDNTPLTEDSDHALCVAELDDA
jgi:endonuclease/exonuclease/phosphatase family metal-dependent hydrolase